MKFFKSAAAFRDWLSKNHSAARELVVGFYKKESGRGGLAYPQAVDEALCHGWIDGVRHRVGEESYSIRFTPRKRDSIWSAVNLRHVQRLIEEGRMAPPGLAVFQARNQKRAGIYSYENRPSALAGGYRRELEASKEGLAFFESQPPWYRRTCAFWVMSAKKEETRRARLRKLVESSAAGVRLN